MTRKEVTVCILGGALFYVGMYLILVFMDWLPSFIYKFGYTDYRISDWVNPKMGMWIYTPSVYFLGIKPFLINILFNSGFWAAWFLIFGFLGSKLIKGGFRRI